MPIFRRDLSIWEKVIRMILLAMLGIVGVCIAMLEYLNLPATTKDLLETIAVRAFLLWWVGVVVLALYTVLRYRRPESRPTYYTSIGILILVAACFLDVFLRYPVIVYVAGWISLFLLFYDMFRFYRFRSGSSASSHDER